MLFGPTEFSHLTFYFAWSRLHIARAFGTERTALICIKKWRIMTRKKSPSTSFKRALFEVSLVWLESLINCSNVWKPSIDSQTLSSPISFTPIIYGSRISNTISNWTEQSQDFKIIDTHFSKNVNHSLGETLLQNLIKAEAYCNIGWDGCGWLCKTKKLFLKDIVNYSLRRLA